MTDKVADLGYLAGATLFRRVSEKLHVDGDRIYRDHQLPFKASWFSVYYILAQAAAPKTVGELASEIGFTHITVKNVSQELVANGLAVITAHPTDKRAKHIVLTAAGRALLPRLQPVWEPFRAALKQVLDAGHPDVLNIIGRIERELIRLPLAERLQQSATDQLVEVLDYKPSLKSSFYELAGNWLRGVLNGALEEEDLFTLHHPDEAYLAAGGFVFFAVHAGTVVGCVALKRLDENTFEFAKLFIEPTARQLGITTKLIARCISRCRENNARQLWLQTTMRMPEAHRLYYKLGFVDEPSPLQMAVLQRTEKIMVLGL